VLILLLHFSVAVSRLSDQTKVLSQRLALLEHRQNRTEEQVAKDAAGERDTELEREESRPSRVGSR
jgi:hypothetical protein